MAAHPRQLLQHAARASVAVHFLATTASNSSGVNCTDIGTPGCEDLPSTAAIVGGVVGGLSVLTLGLAAALIFAVARIYGWSPLRGGRRWAWDTGAGKGGGGAKGDVEAALELARPPAKVPSIVTTRLAADGSGETAIARISDASAASETLDTPALRGFGGGSGSPASPLRTDWRDSLIDPEKIQILRRRDGRPWVLGGGAFGQVYKALYDGVQVVAAKVITGLRDERILESFAREAAILRDMRDRNIIQFVGVCLGRGGDEEDSGIPDEAMMIQEFAEAGDLYKALKWRDQAGRRVYGWYARGRKAAADIARGLHYLHSHKTVHLDLKSSNVLLARDGTCKLADVGLARSLKEKAYLTNAGTMGTFSWSAPEVLTGQQVTTAADIFSYGIVLWEVVTGEIPTRGTMRDPRVPEECPQDIVDLIDRCTSLDPSQRPTAKQIVQQIEGMGGGTPSHAEERGAPLRTASLGPWRNQLPHQVSKYMPSSRDSPMSSNGEPPSPVVPQPPPYPPPSGGPARAGSGGLASVRSDSLGKISSSPFAGAAARRASLDAERRQREQQQQGPAAVAGAGASDSAGEETPGIFGSPGSRGGSASSAGARRSLSSTRRGSGLAQLDEEEEEEEEEEEHEAGLADAEELEEMQRRQEAGVESPPAPTLRLEDLPPLSSQDVLFR